MCGILGSIGTTPLTKRILPIIATYMNDRGKDSWGVTDGVQIYKSVGQIVEQFEEFDLESPIYHTRHSTVGAVSYRNAHPFEFQAGERRVVGVHNGFVSNWSDLKKKYQREALECDSENIFMHLAEGQPVSEIEGWGAVVWYEQDGSKPLQWYHSKFEHGDLAIAKLESGEIVYGSTQKSVEIGCRLGGGRVHSFYKTETDIKYTIDAGELVSVGPMVWGGYPIVYNTVVKYSGQQPIYFGSRQRQTTKSAASGLICAKRECNTIRKVDELICGRCLYKLEIEYGFKQPAETLPVGAGVKY